VLLKLPLNLKSVCHLEEKPEASLLIYTEKLKKTFVGSYEDYFLKRIIFSQIP